MKKSKTLIIIAVLLAIVAALAYYFLLSAAVDEAPPSLTLEGAGYQGFITDERGFYEFDEGDVANMKGRIPLLIDTYGDPVLRDTRLSYYYAHSPISYKSILRLINAGIGNKCLLATYTDGSFKVYPEGPYEETETVDSSFVVSAGTPFAVVCRDDYNTWGFQSGDVQPPNYAVPLNAMDSGWNLTFHRSSELLSAAVSSCSDRVISVWVQDGPSMNDFVKTKSVAPTLIEGYHMVWFNLRDDRGTCPGNIFVGPDLKDPPVDGPVVGVCPEDAFVCSDGSTVVRSLELDCEFEACPDNVFVDDPGVDPPSDGPLEAFCASDTYDCEDGTVLLRELGLDCDFSQCPVSEDSTLPLGPDYQLDPYAPDDVLDEPLVKGERIDPVDEDPVIIMNPDLFDRFNNLPDQFGELVDLNFEPAAEGEASDDSVSGGAGELGSASDEDLSCEQDIDSSGYLYECIGGFYELGRCTPEVDDQVSRVVYIPSLNRTQLVTYYCIDALWQSKGSGVDLVEDAVYGEPNN